MTRFMCGPRFQTATHSVYTPFCSLQLPRWRRQGVAAGRYQRRLDTVCMANQRRVARVSKQIEREIGSLLQGDQVVLNAVCPEHREGYDSSISALASVTEVRLSSDLQVAKVYLSIFSDQEGKATAIKGLSKLQGYVRTRLAHQMQLRLVPEIRFIHDEAAERGEEVLQLLERIKRQDAGEEDSPPVSIATLPEEERARAAFLRTQQPPTFSDAQDGFLDLDEPDEEEEGFLLDIDEEEDGVVEGEVDEFELGEDRTEEVVNEYLAGSWPGPESEPSSVRRETGGRRKKRKYRSKTR